MKNNKERTLAYQLAKEINHNDLAEVSGGSGFQMTSKATFRPSGSSGEWDSILDISVDW